MNPKLKYKKRTFAIILSLTMVILGLQQAKADLITFVGEFDTGTQNPSDVLATANANGVDFDEPLAGDLSVDVRLTPSTTSVTNEFGTFSITFVSTGVYTVSFDIASGFVLGGIAVHNGRGNVDNFYSVNDETFGTNEGPVSTPINASGRPGGLSNLDFLLETGGANVPEGGMTAMLMGLGLTSLGLVRRFLIA
jgi:hypothetical protein